MKILNSEILVYCMKKYLKTYLHSIILIISLPELMELTALDSQLNQLHSALDELERQHDSVHTRVKELLESTRAMRADAERQESAHVGSESCLHAADDTPDDRHSNGCDPC